MPIPIPEAVAAQADAATTKADQVRSLPRYLALAALAGAYVGIAVVVLVSVSAPLVAAGSPAAKLVQAAVFGIALTLVVFAGAELFTGNAFVLTVGALDGKSRLGQLAGVWGWSYAGNLIGSLGLAWLVAQSGALGGEPQRGFVESVAATKMGLDFWPALARGILCNWLVCLALWCSMRTANEGARLVVIFWCLFAFIGAGFEHSVANMTLLAIALFQPHGEAVTWLGYAQNLVPVTIGNVIGGAFFVGGLYWFAARGLRFAPRPVMDAVPGVAVEASPAAAR